MDHCWASQVVLLVKKKRKLPVNAGDIRDMVSIPELGRSPGGGHGSPFQYCLENLMDRGVWQVTVHRVTRSRTRLKQLIAHTHACMDHL